MATLPKEHNEIYFDSLIRTNKADSLLSLIKATYFAYESGVKNVKEEIAKRLENAYNLFRKNPKGTESGSGSYSGTMDQFSSQYTLGHEMGIWMDSDLHLTELALEVAKDQITVKDYLRIIFFNYIQPVDKKIIHPLYMLLKYMKEKNITEVNKDDFSLIYGVKCDGGNANGLVNLLIDTDYFSYKSGVIYFNEDYSMDEVISQCNTKYLKENGYEMAIAELNDSNNYYQYLTTIIRPECTTFDVEYKYSLDELADILKTMYDTMTPKPIGIHLFGIKYGSYIQKQGYNVVDIIVKAGIPSSYKIELSKGINLNSYVKITNEKMFTYWLCSANSAKYNHAESFKKNGEIDWAQDKHFKKANIGDIVFIYSSSPIKQVKYKCIITEKDILKQNKIDDSEFWTNPQQDEEYVGKYIKFKLLCESNDEKLKYENLLNHGLIAAPQGAYRLIGDKLELANYIDSIFEGKVIEQVKDIKNNRIDFEIQGKGINLIVYGTPGCGKSFYVDNELLKDHKMLEDNTRERVIRTTFYQDYTNTDFIGQILPHIEKDNDGKYVVTYKFNPGPFSLALKEALSCDGQEVALVIEELNRGNAAAIFGDIFQLLDRDEHGISKYAITNVNVTDYLNKEFGTDFKKIKIPGNLLIYATMNTSDQNVFTLDTAFKRRWEFKKIKNEFKKDHEFAESYVPGMGLTWKDFVNSINKYMTNDQSVIGAEDKQVGVYFIDKDGMRKTQYDVETIEQKEEFAYKIFEYLWDDVAKFDRKRWFKGEIKTLDDLIDKYILEGIKVFNEEVFGQELYNNGSVKKDIGSSETK